MIFQSTIDQIDAEISQLLAALEAKKQRQCQLLELDSLTDHTLEGLAAVVSKTAHYAPNAIASLKSAVLELFGTDDGNDGGNQPTEPTPDDDPDEPELLCLNGETGDCLTTADLEEAPKEESFPTVPSTTEQNENKCTQEGEQVAYCELVNVTDALAYQRKHDGEIVCTYIGFLTKTIAQSWMEFFEAISSKVELRQAKRMQAFKWEMKVKGLSIGQIERYAKDCDFAKSYNSTESPAQVAGIEPPSGWKQVQIEREPLTCILEEGDVVEVLSDRHAGYKGHVGTLNLISKMSELPFSIKFANGHVRYYQRTELKIIAKGEAETETKPGLHTGQVLMGNRVVTTGAYIGAARRSRIANGRRGTADKVAAMQLVKDGLDPEQALAVVKGGRVDDASDF